VRHHLLPNHWDLTEALSLGHNLDLLNGLTGPTKANGAPKGKLNNILMHLRKCLQHPYLYEETIEPRGLPQQETHEKLIDASAKLRFLKVLLPKLKARGHRVLLFSQVCMMRF
jgi:SNF2 family DNA or RNA helicase